MGLKLDQTPYAWVTLVTSPSYLPGAVVLAHSLKKHGSQYPLVVLVTPGLGKAGVQKLKHEQQRKNNIIVHEIEILTRENTGSVAERFKDTFTKLRAFQLHEVGLKKGVFLDADMAVFRNPDSLFDAEPRNSDSILANHACVCNLDHNAWAPSHWVPGNCAYTPIQRPNAGPTQVHPSSRPTYHLLNSGMFVFRPSRELWSRMLEFFNTSEKVLHYQFPDQDLLADFFKNKWQALSWRYNAIKTMRYWHPAMWSDSEVVIVHYIVDKPWQKRIGNDGVAGHLGRDGVTHKWWWDLYQEWLQDGQKEGTIGTGDEPDAELDSPMAAVAIPLNEKTDWTQVQKNLQKQWV